MAATHSEVKLEEYENFLADAYKIISNEGERHDIAINWKVVLPTYSLLSVSGDHYFQRYRWFTHNNFAFVGQPRDILKSIAPAYIEEWETWKQPNQWLNLLNQWNPDWLIKTVGSSLGALQLVVDVVDHLLIREVVQLAEKSSIMIALLTSAESLLKWPAHFLTLMHRERNHPLDELKTFSQRSWEQQKIQRAYLQKCATTLSETHRTCKALHTEIVRIITNKISKSQTDLKLGRDDLLHPPKAATMKSLPLELSQAGPDQPVKVTLTIRKRTPQDCMADNLAKPSKLRRHELDRGFIY